MKNSIFSASDSRRCEHIETNSRKYMWLVWLVCTERQKKHISICIEFWYSRVLNDFNVAWHPQHLSLTLALAFSLCLCVIHRIGMPFPLMALSLLWNRIIFAHSASYDIFKHFILSASYRAPNHTPDVLVLSQPKKTTTKTNWNEMTVCLCHLLTQISCKILGNRNFFSANFICQEKSCKQILCASFFVGCHWFFPYGMCSTLLSKHVLARKEFVCSAPRCSRYFVENATHSNG